jgi:hypothetical protein
MDVRMAIAIAFSANQHRRTGKKTAYNIARRKYFTQFKRLRGVKRVRGGENGVKTSTLCKRGVRSCQSDRVIWQGSNYGRSEEFRISAGAIWNSTDQFLREPILRIFRRFTNQDDACVVRPFYLSEESVLPISMHIVVVAYSIGGQLLYEN